MKLIFQELFSALRKNILSKKWFKILTIVLVLIVVAAVVKVIFYPAVEVGVIGDKDLEEWNELTESFDSLQNGEINTTSVDPTKMETAISFFFLAANEGDMNRFSSVIDPTILEKDFTSKFDLIERLSKYEEAMRRISRNGTLSKVEIVSGYRLLGSGTRIVLDLYYEDLSSPIRVNLVVQIVEESHAEHSSIEENEYEEEGVVETHQPLIITSIWELIDSIEGK